MSLFPSVKLDMNSELQASTQLLRLLQLVSPSLPIGAYSYSEALETLTQAGTIATRAQLQHWIEADLRYGAARLDGAIVVRVVRALQTEPVDWAIVQSWNDWYGAARETEELRNQSLQMGRSLFKVLKSLDPRLHCPLEGALQLPIVFAIAIHTWGIDLNLALLGYFQSWSSNLIAAGIKLIPLGQTDGQRLQWSLQPAIEAAVTTVVSLEDDELMTCGWGLAIASMQHEKLYSRLFRS